MKKFISVILEVETGKRFEKEKDDYGEIMVDIMFYYMNHYPFSYKKFSDRFIEEEVATEIYNNPLKLLVWLESFQIGLK